MKSPQEKPGTMRSKSVNSTQKGGRSDGTEPLRGGTDGSRSTHYPHKTSNYSGKRGTGKTGTEVQPNSTVVKMKGGGNQSVTDVSAPKRKKLG